MAIHKIFSDKLKNMFGERSRDPLAISSLNPNKGTPQAYATYHSGIAMATQAIALGVKSTDAQRLTIVLTEEGEFASECVLQQNGNPQGRFVVAKLTKAGSFRAATYDPETGASSALPNLRDDKILDLPLSGIYGLVLAKLMEADPGFKSMIHAYAATQKREELICICDYCYYAVVTGVAHIMDLSGGSFANLTTEAITEGKLNGTILAGPSPVCLCGKSAKSTKKVSAMTLGEAKAEFRDWRENHSNWTEFEKDLIPAFPDDIPVPPETLSIANKYVKSQGRKLPMVNFMWRGITGYGKSTGTEMLAALLNMPLVRITCHPQMERQEFLTNFVPDSSAKTPTITPDELPTPMEIDLDPATAYRKMTGVDKPDATTDECNELYLSLISDRGNTPRFKLVESEFIKGLQHGWIVEVQEVSRIRDSGVMVGLNEYDRPGARIPLVDGRFVRRHPEALVLYTDNVGYNSCRALDPSFLRRMACIYDSYDMPKDKVLERVVRNTDFDDPVLLDKMYNLWRKIADYCRDQDITEGSISICELEQWANAVMIDGPGSVLSNCMSCVVSKATSDVVEQNLIKSTVLAQADI